VAVAVTGSVSTLAPSTNFQSLISNAALPVAGGV
jgi:hypothetical protein